jgi:uncharacterized damage-inducible protein DinB
MHRLARLLVVAAMLLTSTSLLAAQDQPSVMEDLIDDVTRVEARIVALARAIPPEVYEWRPGEGVRSVGEVLIHIAGDNFFIPVLMGVSAPAGTGIDPRRETVLAYEARTMTRDEVLAELENSFTFLKQTMRDTPEARLMEQPPFERREVTTRALWILTNSHLHEHLGQLIGYARSNGVTPPWSN